MMTSYATLVFVLLPFFSITSSGLPGLKPRYVCYYDDVLLSFETWRPDSEPYCSSLLGISDYTTTVGPTKSHTYAVSIPDYAKYSCMAGLPPQLLRQLGTIQ